MEKYCMGIGKYKSNGLSPTFLLGRDINKNCFWKIPFIH